MTEVRYDRAPGDTGSTEAPLESSGFLIYTTGFILAVLLTATETGFEAGSPPYSGTSNSVSLPTRSRPLPASWSTRATIPRRRSPAGPPNPTMTNRRGVGKRYGFAATSRAPGRSTIGVDQRADIIGLLARQFARRPGLGRGIQISRAAHEPGMILSNRVEHLGGRIASRDSLGVRGEGGQLFIPAIRRLAPDEKTKRKILCDNAAKLLKIRV